MNRDDDNGIDAGVIISGTADQQKAAEDLIMALVDDDGMNFKPRNSNSVPAPSANEDLFSIDWGAVIKQSVKWILCVHS